MHCRYHMWVYAMIIVTVPVIGEKSQLKSAHRSRVNVDFPPFHLSLLFEFGGGTDRGLSARPSNADRSPTRKEAFLTRMNNVLKVAEAGNEKEKDTDREIDCFREEFEEVDNVVSAVMGMDAIVQQSKIKNGGHLVENKSNFSENICKFETNAGNVLEDSEKSDDFYVSLKCSIIEETMEEGRVRGKNLNPSIEVYGVDSENEIENGEEAKESRDDQEQNKDIEVSEANGVPPVFNQDLRTEWKKEKKLELHVGGLHKNAVEQDLFDVFGKFGEVQIARIVRHPITSKSQGFAFIQYATVEQAKKVLFDLKDGIEVRGKHAKISPSHDRDTLYLGNICKTWTKEDVLEKLKGCGIEDVDEIQVPNDPKNERKIKGFAFLRFNTCCDAKAAFHRLRKPDALFGNARCAKVAFAHTPVHPREEVRLQVKTIYIERIPKSWDVQRLKTICEQYGETKKVKISRNFGNKGKDFGFISFSTHESAVACLKGVNNVQFGGGIKVKAYIARPLVGRHLQKSTCGRMKPYKRCRSTGGWKIKGHAKSEGAEKKSDMNAKTVIYKSKTKGTEEKAAAVVHKNNQDPSNSKHTIEGETNEQESIPPQAHAAGLYAKPKKTDDKRKNRKRQRDPMYSSSHGRPSHSSGSSKSRSYLRKGPNRSGNSVAYGIPFKEAYVAPRSGYPSYAYGAISESKRLSSDLYFKHALGKDALPHAGFLEPAFGKQSFDIDDYPARRTGEYNSPGNQGPAYRAGLAFSRSYVPNSFSYAGYEASGSGRVSGAYPPMQTRY
ncbi:RNA-binding (RRM/RBD/RNP motifs) family protein [Theobroma cacao]|uniref:RNA-binding (RRM/RBD/RNP motifs) family protein n=1 Tax=Theobroma cacao TaxID=3641 RepID=A0A061G168_THECC|nr:RNA-binding (RRM/RBD/RNP motifs) family protein [Theobroma cacao]